MVKATLITVLIYWIIKCIYNILYKSLDDIVKLRYKFNKFRTSEWILVYITALSRVFAYGMAFATTFYMIFKYM